MQTAESNTLLFTGSTEDIALAQQLYKAVAKMPIISPHGHVNPGLLLENKPFSNAAELFVAQDHYVTRLLHANGVQLADLGVGASGFANETAARKAWSLFCENFHLLAGTASGFWLTQSLNEIFNIAVTPCAENAAELYDHIGMLLQTEDLLPRALFARFGISVLATTDDPIDDLAIHRALNSDPSFSGRIVPTFRPDRYLDPRAVNWVNAVEELLSSAGFDALTYASFIASLESRRAYFIDNGAVSADHGVTEPYTCILEAELAAQIFERSLLGQASAAEMRDFAGHMLTEMARMSSKDGLVMTLHAGVVRNHSATTFEQFGPDSGHDIPVAVEFTKNLQPLLNAYGLEPKLTLILFCLDESNWNREIAPLAGFYPSVRIGAPWWFLDAPDSALRFREATTEIAGFYRGSGFIDDTRAFLSIPARHDMARRIDALYLARLVSAGRLTVGQAEQIAHDLVDAIPKAAFKL